LSATNHSIRGESVNRVTQKDLGIDPKRDESVAQKRNDATEKKRQERALRRSRLKIGDAFRPYELFDEFSIMPDKLMAVQGLGPGPKLLWGLSPNISGEKARRFLLPQPWAGSWAPASGR
jgi:hypothetical protein